ncbi:WhiB family transcriptional regulator [Kitasatospora sp. NPDC088351]|uniref:WhiB family transcriptional regulator n=1 Tax=Kitasatospora sp. NPDC088351 TaxID=3155180 RepID=UPI003437AA26
MTVFHLAFRPNSAARTATSTTTPAPAPRPCQGVDPELFYPKTESSSALGTTDGEQAALYICARCPLTQRTTCLTDQLSHGPTNQWGVSGGTTAAQRRHILRHGTPSDAVTAQLRGQLGQATTPALPLAG